MNPMNTLPTSRDIPTTGFLTESHGKKQERLQKETFNFGKNLGLIDSVEPENDEDFDFPF